VRLPIKANAPLEMSAGSHPMTGQVTIRSGALHVLFHYYYRASFLRAIQACGLTNFSTFSHLSTKERRKKVAKKEERKRLLLPPPPP